MCVFAAAGPGILGLGGTLSNMFIGQLALTAVSGITEYQAQRQATKYKYEAAVRAAEAANQAYVDQTEGLNSRLREEKQLAEQEKFKVKKKTLQAQGAIRASERTGLTVDLLLADADRERGNWTNALNQTIQSADRQYGRDLKGLEAQRKGRYNTALDIRNEAAANAPSLLGTIGSIANAGLTNYINYRALAI